jgi:hypothetical protein
LKEEALDRKMRTARFERVLGLSYDRILNEWIHICNFPLYYLQRMYHVCFAVLVEPVISLQQWQSNLLRTIYSHEGDLLYFR